MEWKIRSHDRPDDLAARLRRAGFVPEPRETVLIGLAAEQAARQAGSVPEVSIRLTDTAEDMRQIAAMESEVWAQDWSWLADDLAGRVATGQFAVFVAEVGDQVVSWPGRCCKPARTRGPVGSPDPGRLARPGHLPCAGGPPGRTAAGRGVRYLQVDASDDSRPILERLGFVAVTTTTPYVWDPAEGEPA